MIQSLQKTVMSDSKEFNRTGTKLLLCLFQKSGTVSSVLQLQCRVKRYKIRRRGRQTTQVLLDGFTDLCVTNTGIYCPQTAAACTR